MQAYDYSNDDFLSLELAKDRAAGRLTRKPPGADMAKTTRQLKSLIEQLAQGSSTTAAVRRHEPLLTVEDVADRLNVSTRTVENLIATGDLSPLRIRGARRFDRAAVEAYLRSCAAPKRR